MIDKEELLKLEDIPFLTTAYTEAIFSVSLFCYS